jgi:hypothetical protein
MMRFIQMHKPRRRLAVVLLGSAAMVVASTALVVGGAGRALAAGSYGAPPPVAPVVPGGFSAVVTSQTIGPAGGTIGPLSVDGITTTLTVPAGAFPVPVQITLTAPDLASIGAGGFAGHSAVAGVGIQVQEHGAKYPGTFLKSLSLTLSSSSITSSSIVVVWNGTAFVTESSATVTAGRAAVTFDSDPNFAVLASTGTAPSPIPGATGATTGKPFLGEGILAGLLLLLGVIGLGYARRRRAGA